MAKKILNAVTFGLSDKLIGGKKKAAAPATTAASTSSRPKPIITQLGSGLGGGLPPRPAFPAATLLSGYSSKLGS